MFHEVASPLRRGQKWRHQLLGRVHRLMAGVITPAAGRIFLSNPAWRPILRRVCPRLPPCEWLPIPSTVATQADPAAVAEIRARFGAGSGRFLLGHFGTYGAHVADTLRFVLPEYLGREARWAVLLMGLGSEEFAVRLKHAYPDLAGRIHSTGGLPARGVAEHLAACDLLFQPYPDGVSSRRTSLMAGLGMGRPIVTTWGPSTEALWAAERIVAGVLGGEPRALIELLRRLGEDAEARCQFGERALRGYAAHFSLRRTVDTLRQLAAEEAVSPAGPGPDGASPAGCRPHHLLSYPPLHS
jgi:hypothetical protein